MVVRELERFYTADDLWELSHQPEYADKKLELSNGSLIVMSPIGQQHGIKTNRVSFKISSFVYDRGLGEVTAAETGYVLGKTVEGRDVVRAPDIGYIRAERLSVESSERYVKGAPDLAVEVMSPNDTADEIQKKVGEYLQYGTRLVWVVFPALKTVVVRTVEGSRTLTEKDTLEGGDVLPGFVLLLSELFS